MDTSPAPGPAADPAVGTVVDAAVGPGHPDRGRFKYSVVIPVYNSEGIVGTTVDRVVETFTAAGLDHEVVLVNDGSSDGSWEVIAEKARTLPQVVALDLLRNYGQHHANLAGLREATGDYVITMDDDLQNPPDQALLLIDAALAGHDVVFGEFASKQHAGHRKLGSRLVGSINRRVFHQPDDLVVSNYRILHRDVVDRICASRTAHPYITGQALIYSRHPGNVTVRHEPRTVGKSNYNLVRILRLVLTILFSYSSYPLRLAATVGFGISAVSFVLGAIYFLQGVFGNTHVQGWTTTVVLLSIFNGFTIALLSMLGEYVVRTLNAVSAQDSYHVQTRVPE
ncbi:glycosyltransferase [Nocardioides panaciterrulae]|uniref:Glycosyltransferase involved in cell wall biosynthesis n=1 Tax=Nocardioides panaciterrulae TaxID=661492 RepID=A0A7Y9E7Y9_9ACTN|nr:glycosyltransferase involved in cell wall biosynthesis [Nocardioides panaciterrulae]